MLNGRNATGGFTQHALKKSGGILKKTKTKNGYVEITNL